MDALGLFLVSRASMSACARFRKLGGTALSPSHCRRCGALAL